DCKNAKGDTPAHCAAKNDDAIALELLLNNSHYDSTITNNNNETVVDIVYKNNFKECIEVLEKAKNKTKNISQPSLTPQTKIKNPNIPQPSLKAKLWRFFYAYNTALKISVFGLSCIFLTLFMVNKR